MKTVLNIKAIVRNSKGQLLTVTVPTNQNIYLWAMTCDCVLLHYIFDTRVFKSICSLLLALREKLDRLHAIANSLKVRYFSIRDCKLMEQVMQALSALWFYAASLEQYLLYTSF